VTTVRRLDLSQPLPELEPDPRREKVVPLAVVVLPLLSAICSVVVLVGVLVLLT
jgi:hypothetical protein